MGGLGDTRDYSAETLFQSFLQKTIVSSLAMGRDVHSLVLSIQGALKDGFGEAVVRVRQLFAFHVEYEVRCGYRVLLGSRASRAAIKFWMQLSFKAEYQILVRKVVVF